MNGESGMSWLYLSDTFAEHPKVYALTDRQFRLHVTAMLYAARNGTDGAIPRNSIPAANRSRDTAALVHAGLWEETRNGWRIHDWLDWNRSAQQRKQEREANRLRAQRYRERHNTTDDDSNAERNASHNGVTVTPHVTRE